MTLGLILVLTAAFLWAVSNILDKMLVELRRVAAIVAVIVGVALLQ